MWKGIRIKVLKAGIFSADDGDTYQRNGKNGLVVKADKNTGIIIRCGKNDLVRIDMLQPQGKKVMTSADFINGYRLEAGEKFE